MSTTASEDPFIVLPVRRRDLRRRPEHVPGAKLPKRHGGEGDPRYPSSYFVRWVIAFVIDLAIHFVVAVLIATGLGEQSLMRVLFLFLIVSFADRVLVQWVFRATIGKALLGLRVIDYDTNDRMTVWRLTQGWLWSPVMMSLRWM